MIIRRYTLRPCSWLWQWLWLWLAIASCSISIPTPTLAQETLTHTLGGGRKVGIAVNVVAPTISITSPTGGTVSGTITIQTAATSPVGIFSVQLLIDSTIFGTVNVPPYNFTWDTTLYSNASHTLQAEATDINGLVSFSNTVSVTVNNVVVTTPFFANLPINWVSNFVSTPTVTITLGSSPNKGPNCHTETYGSCSGSVAYTSNLSGLIDAADNWRDNADQLTGGSQAAHFIDIGWQVLAPPALLNNSSNSYDNNSALFTLPAKCSGNATDSGGPCGTNGSGEATQFLIINSTTPNTTGQTVCSHGIPGIGSGIYEPGCANDEPNMWHLQIPASATSPAGAGSHQTIYSGSDCTANKPGCPKSTTQCGMVAGNGNPLACYVNHVAVYNSESDLAPGSTQSGFSGTKLPTPLVNFNDGAWGANTTPSTRNPWSKHVVFEYNYIHGYDPGDPGQPNSLGAPYEDSAGTCTAFAIGTPPGIATWPSGSNFISQVTVSGSTLTHSPVLNSVGKDISTFWGPNIYNGEIITLGGGASGYPATQFTVAAFDPTATNSTLTVTSPPPTGGVQGPKNPATSSQSASGGLISWTTITGIQTAATPGAQVQTLGGNIITSQFAIGTAFGLTIPSTATINGVQFIVGTNLSSNDGGTVNAHTTSVQLIKSGSAVGTAKGPGSNYTGTGVSYVDETWGTASDLWGTTWTPADINNGNFGIQFQSLLDSSDCTHCGSDYFVHINNFRIVVTYTILTGTTPVEFSASDSSNNITSVPGYISAGCTPSTGNCASQTNYGGAANPVVFTPGCGDDVGTGLAADGDNLLVEYNQIEKIHGVNVETHAIGWGFANGPIKFAHNVEQDGSISQFSGGAPTDVHGGPSSDNEVRGNFISKNLNYRFLTGGAGNSPSPPWGCGPIDGNAAHDTCPFSWSIKNTFELKVGHRNLIAGNVIENCWADGQTGRCLVIDERTCSGGAMCGIYDKLNLPSSGTDNIRVEGNWLRNMPQPGGMSPRSGTPGNGGGGSFPMIGVDYIGNIVSNAGDNNQFGSPGGPTGGIITFGPSQNFYNCTATTFSGSGTAAAIAQGYCQSFHGDVTGKVSSIIRSGCPSACIVTVTLSVRADPYLCPGGVSGLATCAQNGQTFILVPGSAAPAGIIQGAFPMISGVGNWAADGTGGTGFTYIDSRTVNETVCSGKTVPTCNTANVITTAALASLAYKFTDITGGNPVQASTNVYMDNQSFNVLSATGTGTVGTYHMDTVGTNSGCSLPNCVGMAVGDPIAVSGVSPSCFNHTGTVASVIDSFTFTMSGLTGCSSPSTSSGTVTDTSCSANHFAQGGSSPAVQACGASNPSCTSPATSPSDSQLRVFYKAPNAAGTGNACVLSNGAGLPQLVTFQSNTVLSPNIINVHNDTTSSQAYYNLFFNNLFMSNDGGVAPSTGSSDWYCTQAPSAIEGTVSANSAKCWDSSTLQFYSNVLTTRKSSLWPVVSQSGGLFPTPGSVVNYFPTMFNCPSGSGSGCVGPAGFTGATPTHTYPTGSCPNANAPFNCPLMAAPWQTTNPLTLADLNMSGSFYSGRGANSSTVQSLMTATQYVCPAGAVCGTSTAITQVAATTTVATYTASNSLFPGEYLATVAGCGHTQFNLSGVYVATANSSQFTIKGSFSSQSPVSDVCAAITGPSPD